MSSRLSKLKHLHEGLRGFLVTLLATALSLLAYRTSRVWALVAGGILFLTIIALVVTIYEGYRGGDSGDGAADEVRKYEAIGAIVGFAIGAVFGGFILIESGYSIP